MMLSLVLWLAFWATAGAGQAPAPPPGPRSAPVVEVPKPGPATTCPVCGMFVAKYPNWVATIVWRDGSAGHFDGAKDMFIYVLDLARYAPGRSAKDMLTIAVTEFYDLRAIDARQAYFVVGSDVLGPMGREFIPLATRADAEEFRRDHHGTGILRFGDVTPQVLRDVDEGRVARCSQSPAAPQRVVVRLAPGRAPRRSPECRPPHVADTSSSWLHD